MENHGEKSNIIPPWLGDDNDDGDGQESEEEEDSSDSGILNKTHMKIKKEKEIIKNKYLKKTNKSYKTNKLKKWIEKIQKKAKELIND